MKLKQTQLNLPVKHLEKKRLISVLNFHHHVKRNVVQLNILVDEVSRQARLDTNSVWSNAFDKLRKKKPDLPDNATIYDFSK